MTADTAFEWVFELAPGANPNADPGGWLWRGISGDVLTRDMVTAVLGQPDEFTTLPAGTCGLRLDNDGGHYSTTNPLGRWYRRIGKNTPFRWRIRHVADDFNRVTSSGWGTSSWASGGLGGRAWTRSGGSASDYSTAAGEARHSHPTTNVLRRTVLAVALDDVEQLVDVATPSLITGASLVTGLLFRYTDASNYYWLRAEFNTSATVTAKISKTVAGVTTELAVANPVPSLTYGANTPLRIRSQVIGSKLAVKIWRAANDEPAGWTLTATDSALRAPGATGVQSWVVGGNTNAVPLVPVFTNYELQVDRFNGYVPAWPLRWGDKSGADPTVPIVAYGITQRLQQGTPDVLSAMRRTIEAAGPQAYYPLEEGTAAGQAASALPGHPPMIVSDGVKFEAVDDRVGEALGQSATLRFGTSALAELSAGGMLQVTTLPASVTAACASSWTAVCTNSAAYDEISGDIVLLEVITPGGTFAKWQIVRAAGDPTSEQVRAITGAGATTTVIDHSSVGNGLNIRGLSVKQNGANLDVALYWHDNTPSDTASVAGTLTGPTGLAANTTRVTAPSEIWLGHLALFAGYGIPYTVLDEFAPAGLGMSGDSFQAYFNEPVTERLARLCAEAGIPLDMPALPAQGIVRMGWQPPGTWLDLIAECVAVDGGELYEHQHGYRFLPRWTLYNQPAAMTLDFDAGQVANTPQPTDDDQRARNDITIKRESGSFAHWTDEAHINGTTTSPAHGRLKTELTMSLSTDAPLANLASWLGHQGTVPGLRWPTLDWDLQRSPALMDAWLCCRVGSRVTAINPPAEVTGEKIDIRLDGYTETGGDWEWTVSANGAPASPWRVGVVGGPQRMAAKGSTLGAGGLTETGTSFLLVSTAANGPWVTDPSRFPLDVGVGGIAGVGGEQITLSAISGTTSPQSATVLARGVNGVQRAWDAGEEIQVWDPARFAR